MKTKKPTTTMGTSSINTGINTDTKINNTSPLLSLPPELRLTIYNHLLPTQNYLYFNHCPHISQSRIKPNTLSPLHSHLTTHRILTTWFRSHGLHLPQVSHQLRREYTDILRRRAISIVACCVGCLERVVSWGTRVHGGWIRGILVGGWWVRAGSGFGGRGGDVRGGSIKQVMRGVGRVYGRWFGGEGLMVGGRIDAFLGGIDVDSDGVGDGNLKVRGGRDKAEYRWGLVVEYVRVIGRKSGRNRKRRRVESGIAVEGNSIMDGDEDVGFSGMGHGNQDQAEADDSGDDEEDEEDNDNTAFANTFPNAINTTNAAPIAPLHHLHHPHLHSTSTSNSYFHNPTIIELSRETKRYRIDGPRDVTTKVMRIMSRVQTLELEGDENEYGNIRQWWRNRTRQRMRRGWGWEGGMKRGEVVREEVWVGCCFW